MVFQVLGIAWLGAARGGRAASVLIDRSRARRNIGGVLFEALIGALLLV
ncbi:MAG: hypothetical protein ACE5E4_01480 [Candidatus Binatia bacterium]